MGGERGGSGLHQFSCIGNNYNEVQRRTLRRRDWVVVVSPSITRGHRYETVRRHGMLSIGPTLTNIKVGRPVSD